MSIERRLTSCSSMYVFAIGPKKTKKKRKKKKEKVPQKVRRKKEKKRNEKVACSRGENHQQSVSATITAI